MKLRLKLIIILSVLIGALIFTLYAFSYTAVFERYNVLEQNDVNQELQRVNNIIGAEIARIDAFAHDWASWDDSYQFIVDKNPSYIESNLIGATFRTNRINLMIYYDVSGNIVFAKAIDLNEDVEVEIPSAFTDDLSGKDILAEEDDDSVSGIISISEGLLMFSSHPIITSSETGPLRGTLVTGRYIDEAELLRLTNIMNIEIDAKQLDSVLPNDYQTALGAITAQSPVAAVPVDSTVINGYMVLDDYVGQSAMMLKISLPRDIYREGQAAVQSFMMYFLVIGLVVGVVGLVVDDYIFVRPMVSLSEKVAAIGRKKDFDERLQVTGDDEQASLSRDINNMLDSLKEAREKELTQRTEVEGLRREHFKELLTGASRVINSIRYDLRSPLQVIRNATYLLREDPKKALALADMIDESVENAVSTIEDISNKTQTGALKITVTDLRYVIEVAVEMAKIPENIKVVIKVDEEFLAVLLDVAKFQRVLDNLIRNAVEAMPRGGTLTINSRRVNDSIHIEVEDTGIGIEPGEMGKLFQPFYTTKPTGTGLGLFSSKEIIQALGGRIRVDSTLDVGTRVMIVLPNRRD